eukprot:1441440-Rhodomonas_salina.1
MVVRRRVRGGGGVGGVLQNAGCCRVSFCDPRRARSSLLTSLRRPPQQRARTASPSAPPTPSTR